jgi:lipid A disaccharide synthetase
LQLLSNSPQFGIRLEKERRRRRKQVHVVHYCSPAILNVSLSFWSFPEIWKVSGDKAVDFNGQGFDKAER